MRKRTLKISFRLNEQEHEHLKKQATLSGYPMESFIRALVMGVTLKHRSPNMYLELMREMSAIGNNVNQIARAAIAKGYASREDVAQITEIQKPVWLKVKNF
ncbi:MAG: MobC family plasmid mobilization relaxosome protein [Dysosmobacter sp.]|nr:MobC family plasmid mobilization relaxosome protein [Dysosmobacter sp.]